MPNAIVDLSRISGCNTRVYPFIHTACTKYSVRQKLINNDRGHTCYVLVRDTRCFMINNSGYLCTSFATMRIS